MHLSREEYKELKKIQERIILDTATWDEMNIFLDLIVKNDNEIEMLNYMKSLGFNSIDEVKSELREKKKNSDITAGLMIAGGAILLAILLNK